MIEVIQAPNNIPYKGRNNVIRIFLAGSIDMGTAEDWQAVVTKEIQKINISKDIEIYNPRRDDWDSSWVQSKDNKQFSEQVNWELDKQELCDIIFFYFGENSKAPISLLELGLALGSARNLLVIYCHENFYRKGNIDITVAFNGLENVHTNLQDAVKGLTDTIKDYQELNFL